MKLFTRKSRALLGLIAVGLVTSVAAPDHLSAQQKSKSVPAAGGQHGADDPDLPSFAGARIDVKDYLLKRSQHIARLRGVDPKKPFDARLRGRAIRQLQAQETALQGKSISVRGAITANAPVTWSPLGPAPIPNGQTSPINPVSGRVTAIAVHPTNPNVAYVGAAQGGVYRTLDGGLTWMQLMANAQSLAIGAIAIAPSNPSTVYVGTGEGNFSLDSFFGVGVYRIDNADTTPILSGPFNQNAASADVMTGRAITKILVNPSNAANIFVSTANGGSGLDAAPFSSFPQRGVYTSTNATSSSVSFSKLSVATANGGDRRVFDMVFEPGNPNNMLVAIGGNAAAGDGGLYRSTNALSGSPSFTQTLIIGSFANTKFAINKVGATVTALAASDDSALQGLLRRSTDGGATWPTTLSAANGFCGGQCFYDIAVAMDQNNASTIYIGGSAGNLILQKSTDGGASFTPMTAGLHADDHAIVLAPSNSSIVYCGNDGGIFRSNDAATSWSSLNTATFSATQFESLALHPFDPNFMIGGTQDNGTPFFQANGAWTRADFGDGGFSNIDQNAADTTNVTMYHTYFNSSGGLVGYAFVTLTSAAHDSGWSFSGCSNGVDGNGITCADNVLFYAPMALGPGNPNSHYFGSDRLYRSGDVGNTNVVVSQAPLPARISAIGISPQNDAVRIVGLDSGQVFATTTGSSTLTDVTSASFPVGYVARTIIDPNDSNTAFVTFDDYGLPVGQHVWKTANLAGGATTWAASGSGIPDVPVNALVIDPANSGFLYAGTDIGVYFSADSGATWNPYGSGLPRVAVFDIGIQNGGRMLRAATHGLGIWQSAAQKSQTTTALNSSPNPSNIGQNVTFTAQVTASGRASAAITGNVTFTDGATTLGTSGVNNSGVATFSTSTLSAGSHTITATYNGSPIYSGSASAPLTQTVVNPIQSTTTALNSSINPSAVAQNVTFTAVVTSSDGSTATGIVTFMDGSSTLAVKTLSGGSASTSTTTLTAGSHSIVANYGGDSSHTASTSNTVVQVVNQGSFASSTTLNVTISLPRPGEQPNTVELLQSPKATATVTSLHAGTPTGTISFQVDTGTPVVVVMSAGSASTALQLTLGAHTISATYSGDATYLSSVSNTVSEKHSPKPH